ncbi:YciI family protein [Agrococcus sp. Marseille-Q4369]|uniref:YciI family protein n=1 Tax=Agrococcus sp. Marseille-Q4369 TaxID=2810513 RepID=UPI0020165DD4|nr:YciI family protein [Agrococcus sp. Marseille-Q4369]
MARYLLSVFGPAVREPFGEYGSREAMREAMAETGAFNARLEQAGRLLFADGLAEATTATTVDGRGDRPIVTDGPYLESKEHLGGFWVIEAAHLDEAIAIAAEGSRACRNPVEVRPFNSAESVRAALDA